jgi:hypothetical protein
MYVLQFHPSTLPLISKSKGKADPVHAMKVYWRREVQPQSFLTSGLDGSGQIHAQEDLPPSKGTRYPLNRRLVGPQSLSRHLEDEKI